MKNNAFFLLTYCFSGCNMLVEKDERTKSQCSRSQKKLGTMYCKYSVYIEDIVQLRLPQCPFFIYECNIV